MRRIELVLAIACAITLILCVFAFTQIGNASAAYAGSYDEYGAEFYNITNITIVPDNNTLPIEGLNEWYSEDCTFTLINGTLVMNNTTITNPPVTICTHPELAPGIYHITISGFNKYEEEETRHYHGGGDYDGGASPNDWDGDGIPNDIEWFDPTDWKDPDTDDDGLNDFEEQVPGEDGWITDPLNPDSDGDGLLDGNDPCPNDNMNKCVSSGGIETPTPTPTETPVATPPPNEPKSIPWILFGGIIGLCILILVTIEYYKKRLMKEE